MKNKNNNKQGYGILSLMSMSMGIVIGAGIFAKNAELINNGSVFLSMISWVIGSIIVISMLIAFLEVFSITDITDEQSTLSNWGRHLLGARFGRFIGYFMTLVYIPLLMAMFFDIATNELITSINSVSHSFGGSINISPKSNVLTFVLIMIFVSLAFLIIVTMVNANFSKPGKYFQNIGTVVKILPLIFIILLLVVMLMINIDKIDLNQTTTSEYNTKNPFLLICLTMPAILFSFDGFLLAGSLSKEAKNKKTFRLSAIFSVVSIIFIYVLYSLSIYGLGDANADNYGDINNTINNVFGAESTATKVLSPMVDFIIFIAIITSASGLSIVGARMLSDLSAHNLVKDSKANLITKNKRGISIFAGISVMCMALLWYSIFQILDNIAIFEGADQLSVVGYAGNLVIIVAFLIYSIILIGAMVNRFTKKVKVNKVKGFWFFSIVAVIPTILITFYFAFITIEPIFSNQNGIVPLMQLILFVIFIVVLFIVVLFNEIRISKLSKKDIEFKNKKVDIYYSKENDINLNNKKISKINETKESK